MLGNKNSEYAELIGYLFGLQKFGMKLGLENIKSLLRFANNPHQRFPSVHIAGTNGKGSTASFIAAICTASGYKTGLYTSPHIVKFNERIRINAVSVSDGQIAEYTSLFRPEIDALHATFFEATTAIAFKYFSDQDVDIAIIETGMGGRLDSTNVITPLLSIITNISLEHTEHLGDTLTGIAFEKAGIIKEKIPVITAARQFESLEVIRKKAIESNAACRVIDPGTASDIGFTDFDRMHFSYKGPGLKQEFVSGLAGGHQIPNCLLAIEAGFVLQKNGFSRIDMDMMKKGISEVRVFSGLQCRLESIQTDPEIILDAAHNPDGFEALLRAFSAIRDTQKSHLIFGLLSTKDYVSIIDQILKFQWRSIGIVSPSSDEAQENRVLAEEFQRRGVKVSLKQSVWDYTDQIAGTMQENETILMCGSHYLIGEYLRIRAENFSGLT